MGAARKAKAGAEEGMIYFGARIPKKTRLALERYADERRLSSSAAAAQLLEEGLRMERFPGIDFRWTPSGRKAHVTGTGLAAWEMHMIWESHRKSVEKVLKNYPHVSAAQIQAGAAYIEAHREERPSMERPVFARAVKV
ncbi:MAG TPA: hypothetical protein VJB14_00665 [Planctomycetota bacterium]|nr:hypothetical protein [Planctomycetota bacterium]